eukprot:gene12142-2747_t
MKELVLSELGVPGAHFNRDPAEYSVLELKRYLECHGEKKSGRKQDLIDRVRSCIAFKKGMFNYGHVYQYLIESVSQFGLSENTSSETENDDRNFPDTSGYTTTARQGLNLIKSGFVCDMLDYTDDNYYF